MIDSTVVGNFENENTGEVFSVIKETTIVQHTSLKGHRRSLSGSANYRTACGIQLNASSSDESRFTNLNGEVLVKVSL